MDALSAHDILTALADKLRELFPAARVVMEGGAVTLTESGVAVTATLHPYPKVNPRELVLQLRGQPSGFWQGGGWPFKWWKVVRAIDRMVSRGRATLEFETTMKARKLAYASELDLLKTKLRHHGRVYMRLTTAGEPLYFFVGVTRNPADAVTLVDQIQTALPHPVKCTSVVRVGDMTARDVEALGAALTPDPAG